jgi:hypothetical protein
MLYPLSYIKKGSIIFYIKIMKNIKTIGFLIQRKNLPNPELRNIHTELLLMQLELTLLKKTLNIIVNHEWNQLDGLAGDQKCQTRASIILDYAQEAASGNKTIKTALYSLNKYLKLIKNLLKKYTPENQSFAKAYKKNTPFKSLSEFVDTLKIDYSFFKSFITLTLCLSTKISKSAIKKITPSVLSNQQIDKFVESAKIALCTISVQYEQKLSKLYGTKEEQTLLQAVGHKKYSSGMSIMTAFAPSFSVILKKMKTLHQSFAHKLFIFCQCAGLIQKDFSIYQLDDNNLHKITIKDPLTPVMVFESYQYPGSLNQLRNALDFSTCFVTTIEKKCYKECKCANPSKMQPIKNLEEGFHAVFAQHTQFINNPDIDFQKLQLEHSDFKKHYEYLKNLPGFNINDMSKFLIVHVYASTIDDVLKEQEELEELLDAQKSKKS